MADLPKRKSVRLKQYDYASAGWYYVTICTQNRECILGDIKNGKMVLNNAGKIIEKQWLQTTEWFKNTALDVFQIMPNHMHGIVIIHSPVGAGLSRPQDGSGNPTPYGRGNRAPTLGQIVAYFKYQTTKQINVAFGREPLYGRIWQRNYYEHIIRNEDDLEKIRWYIRNNPKLWHRDRNNPENW